MNELNRKKMNGLYRGWGNMTNYFFEARLDEHYKTEELL